MNYPSLYLAWRYIRSAQTEQTIALMSTICFVGIVISTLCLTLVLFVMRGFEKETHAKLQGIHAQISIRGYGDPLNYTQIGQVLMTEFPEVKSWSPTSIRQGIIVEDNEPTIVIIKGIDPAREATVSTLESKIVGSENKPISLHHALHDHHHIIIGSQLAKAINAGIGDTVTLLYAQTEQARSHRVVFDEYDAIVGGIVTTGIDEFDAALVLCSLSLFEELFPDVGIEQLNLVLQSTAHETPVIERLKERFGLDVYSWKDLYPALVSALKLEKYAMLIILALITLVASMSIISLLFMHITQKRGDIAILKAMGTSNSTIMKIFLIIGMSIATVGCICGVLLALIAGTLLQKYPLITLPDAYYVSHIPVAIEWHLIGIVITIVMLLSFIATWIPARKTRSLIIAQVLRFERS